jgi:hypothetical protein
MERGKRVIIEANIDQENKQLLLTGNNIGMAIYYYEKDFVFSSCFQGPFAGFEQKVNNLEADKETADKSESYWEYWLSLVYFRAMQFSNTLRKERLFINKEKLADILDGREYGEEMTHEELELSKANGLVIVFGCSDDLMEFKGAIYLVAIMAEQHI